MNNHQIDSPELPEQSQPVGEACLDCVLPTCNGCVCGEGRSNLSSYNWLDDVPDNDFDIVEVHFKNTRRGFYRNSAHLDLKQGDWVAVDANPGHDIGQVALTGRLVKLQMKRVNLRKDIEILRIFRKAKPADMQRYEQAKAREEDTMIRSRKIAVDLGLKMKIGDVEYQGDGNKAIFYYIADERVDFRQLIKVLADVFKIRVEMKQIGARQEAGRIGGIGPCGRPLCCATWMSNFVSVSTSAARFQDISLNPQNLAGQCAKLKCCINFEVDTYVEAIKQMPQRDVHLETKEATYYYFKADVLQRMITYSTERTFPADTVTIPVARAFEVIALNRQGIKPDTLADEQMPKEGVAFGDLLNQDSINRFDKERKKKKKKRATNGVGKQSKSDQADALATKNTVLEGNSQQVRTKGDKRDKAVVKSPSQKSRGSQDSDGNGSEQADKPRRPKRPSKRRDDKQRLPRPNDRRNDAAIESKHAE